MRRRTLLTGWSLIAFSILFYPQISTAQTQKGAGINGLAAGDNSGYSVSMPDAGTMAIGAPYNGTAGTDAGHVRVYSWNGTAWIQKGADINGEAANDYSGFFVSMPDASTVAIGAPGNDGGGTDAGHVRIYSWNGTAWVQKGADIDGEAAGDESGFSVSMPDANTVAIGAWLNDGNGTDAGHVRVYSWNGTAWVQKGVDIDGEAADDLAGCSVSMPDANTLATGAGGNDGGGTDAGHVRVYSWNGTAWVQKGADIDGEAADDLSGFVSMPDANTLAIGAYLNDGGGTDAGHVRVYSWNGTAWVQKGADIDGEAAEDYSGWPVSMPDANTLAIGAYGNDGGGDDAGHVRVYSWDGAAWVKRGADIDGEAAGDNAGYSASMPDANTLGIGAFGNDGGGNNAGHVRVYEFNALSVTFGAISASIRQKRLILSFTSQTETNNDHFVVEASANGVDFTEIGSIPSKAPGGNSETDIAYSVSIDLDGRISYAGLIVFALLGLLLFLTKRNRKWIVAGMLVCTATFISCEKNTDAFMTDSSNLFIRIAQVDKDGTKSYSKAVKVAEK